MKEITIFFFISFILFICKVPICIFSYYIDSQGGNAEASEDSSGDEASPDKSSQNSAHSEKDEKDVMKAEAKKERKRLKREEKEKRREERRKKKMMRTQEMEVDLVEGTPISIIKVDEKILSKTFSL